MTPFFVFGKPGFSFLIFMLILAKYGAELERAPYPSGGGNGTGNSADFLFMLMFGAVILLVSAMLLPSSSGDFPHSPFHSSLTRSLALF